MRAARGTIAVLVGAALTLAHAPAALAAPDPPGTIYIADFNANAIDVFSAGANGNVAPIRRITGTSTGLAVSGGVAVDAAGDVYVANLTNTVTEYAPGANGNVAPIATLGGNLTGIQGVDDIRVAPNGTLYVGNGSSLEEFAPGANGNVAPLRDIAGANTQLVGVDGVDVDAAGQFYAADTGSSVIQIFGAGANGNVAPTASISGALTDLSQPGDVAIGPSQQIFVADANNSLEQFAAGSTGNVAPARRIAGSATELSSVDDMAVDSLGQMYAANDFSQNIVVFGPGASGNVAPVAKIAGLLTTLAEPESIAVAPPQAGASLSTRGAASIALGASAHDSATLVSGNSPTGTIAFTLYGPNDPSCAGPPAYTSPSINVTGDGLYESPSFTPTATGTYSWRARYSGDANNPQLTTACSDPDEQVSVREVFGTGPNWYSNATLIKQGKPETVTSKGTITLTDVEGEASEVRCEISDQETIENPIGTGVGTDELTQLTFSGCVIPTGASKVNTPFCGPGSPLVTAVGLPWATKLLAGAPLRDEISGVDLELTCTSGGFHETFTGSLAPVAGDSVLIFDPGAGALVQNGYAGTSGVSGTDSLTGPTGDEEVTPEAFPRWYSNGKLITEGELVPVATAATLTFHIPGREAAPACKLKDKETVANPLKLGAGTDQITLFSLAGCTGVAPLCPTGTKLEPIPHGLPWPTHLLPGPPIRDEIDGVDLEFRCSNGTVVATYTGTLTPAVGHSTLEFGEGSGELIGSNSTRATITGTDSLKGPKGDQTITASTRTLASSGSGFTSSGGPIVLTTRSGLTLVCAASWDVGQLNLSGIWVKGVLSVVEHLTGCSVPGLGMSCRSAGAAAEEIVTSSLKGPVGVISKTGPQLGQELTPAKKGTAFAEFECGGGETLRAVIKEGAELGGNCVIATLSPVNTVTSSLRWTLEANGAEQVPQAFASKHPPICNLEVSINGGASERIGLSAPLALSTESEVEVPS